MLKEEVVMPRAIGNRNNSWALALAIVVFVAVVIVVLWLAGVF